MEAAELYTHTHTHTQLRRCVAFLLFVIIPYNSFALDACVPNDSVAVVLTPASASSGPTGVWDNSTQTWKVPFSYGTVHGIAACLSSNYGKKQGGIYKENSGMLVDNGTKVVGGEANGNHCWCKLTYPVVSYWVYDSSYGYADAAGCTGYGYGTPEYGYGCAQRCSGHVGGGPSYSVMGKALFNAI